MLSSGWIWSGMCHYCLAELGFGKWLRMTVSPHKELYRIVSREDRCSWVQ